MDKLCGWQALSVQSESHGKAAARGYTSRGCICSVKAQTWVDPASRLKHYIHAYRQSHSMHREKILKEKSFAGMTAVAQLFGRSHNSSHSLVTLHPFPAAPFPHYHLHQASTSVRFMADLWHLGMAAQHRFSAPFSCCLLPIGIFSGPPLGKSKDKNEKI